MNKKIAMLLIFTFLFNITAAAQNDPAEETVISNEITLSSGGFFAEGSENAAVKWTNKINKSIMSGFCGCVVRGSYVYTAADRQIYKIDRFTGKTVKSANLYGTIGYTYYMTEAEGMLFVQLKNGVVQAFSADTLDSLWISETPLSGDYGQGLSPITYDNGHIYACTVVMNKKYGTGSYFCLDTADKDPSRPDEVKDFIWQTSPNENDASSSGFYGTGAADAGEDIVFGSEGGTIYLADKTSGEIRDILQIGGNMRSSVTYDGQNAYFTSKDGRLYCAEIDENGFGEVKSVSFCADSSCEPVVKNGRVYVGGTDGGYTKGVFCVIDASSLEILAKFDVSGNVQARPLVLESSGSVYAYFTCNYTPGVMMRLADTGNNFDINTFFTPSEEWGQYCINRVNIDTDGVLYYQNDSGWLIALEADIIPDKANESTTAVQTEILSETTTENITETTTTTLKAVSTETLTETTTRAASHSGGGGGGSRTAEYINVAFEIIGDSVHGEAPHTANSVWLASGTYNVKKGSTAEDLVLEMLEKNGFEYVIHSNGYISEITSPDGVRLAEFDNGINSGWMYTQNGVFVQTALRGCMLEDGDTLILLYSDDYTKTDGMRSDSSNEAATENTTQSTESVSSAGTEAETPSLSEPNDQTLNYFADVEAGVWYFYPVECLHAAGIVNGRENGLFCPNDNVTRAEFAVMLHRIFGGESRDCGFADVPANSWYYEAVSWAQNTGAVYGTDEKHFAPFAPITRQDAAAVLYRLTDGKPMNESSDFSDESKISPYAAEAVSYFAENGVISGVGGAFEPKRSVTRAECASLLYEFIQKELLKNVD